MRSAHANNDTNNSSQWKVIKTASVFLLVAGFVVSINYYLNRSKPVFAAPLPVAAYGFNEGVGLTTADASGNGNSANLQGGAAWTTAGKYGNAITFDGTNDVVQIPDSAAWKVNGLSGYTISLWVKVKNVSGSYKVAIGNGSWPADDLHIYKDGSTWSFQLRTSGSWICAGSSSTLSYLSSIDNTYHHVALVLNAPAGRCDLYSDGVVVGSDIYVNGTTSFQTGASYNNLYVGGLNSGQYLNADIDEVRIYTTNLSQAEIQADMSTPIGGTPTPDTVPPVITNVTSGNITASSAVITWDTDEPADSQVEYGLTPSYGQSTTLNTSVVTSHSVVLTGLTANTLYHYRAHSKDPSGNSTVSADFIFTTGLPTPDTTPPIITNVSTSGITASSVTVNWTTDEPADSQVEFGLTTGYGSLSALNPAFITGHSVLLTGLTDNKLYHYRVRSKDASGNLATSSDFTFTTQPLSSGFQDVLVASGVISPTAMEFAPDGRLFVAEKAGKLSVIKNGQLLAAAFYTATVSTAGERGLLGIAFDPNFSTNQYVYIYYWTLAKTGGATPRF